MLASLCVRPRQELETRRIYFDRQAMPGVALLPQRPLTQEQVALLRETFAARYAQSDKAASALVLPHGIDLKSIQREQLVGHDKDVWEQARLEIAAWLNIPPYKLGAAAPATSLEQQQRQYLSHTLRPWLVRWEDELRAKLLTPQEQVLLYWEHDTDVLISADIEARYRAYEIGIRSRFLSPNEVRREENLPPYEGGDKFENPNTSSGASNNDTRMTTNDNSNDTTTRNLARAYLCDVFSRLATLEKSRLETAAKEASVQALLAVYEKLPWSSYVGDALKAVAHNLAIECHLEQVRSRYTSMRGDEIASLAADAERRGQTLRAAVQQYDWHERAVEFARNIIEGERDERGADDNMEAIAG
ncbi:MAG: hypothetical protein KatS3mg038_3577 [Candidatus Kapaibacterium sp.]|nr:MAG: hypothetical protein KatS3mg038_3577 [Candidatus Kapabacteria bacterium]